MTLYISLLWALIALAAVIVLVIPHRLMGSQRLTTQWAYFCLAVAGLVGMRQHYVVAFAFLALFGVLMYHQYVKLSHLRVILMLRRGHAPPIRRML